ncbi:PQ loop repeat [Carpediemonas membranifera]|uniref:PQ loop repeat n=1 Tax=Carpediemonas membranifera TaxID=201153 RepID=A0A8J6AYK4_9EUKA|nr:PQ loop repeat [Carpediemonas membranifera]|eukprot:KAG9390409.1 PQ loop repeat [Carpediemonas membranifera]
MSQWGTFLTVVGMMLFGLLFSVYYAFRPVPLAQYVDIWVGILFDWLAWAISTLLDISMILGATIGYIAQCRDIRTLHSSQGFSSLVTAILLFSNTLRCFWWFGSRYDIALLIQAMLMLVVQLYLLYLAVKYRDPRPPVDRTPLQLVWDKVKNFWNWENYYEYMVVYVLFAAFFFIVTIVFVYGQLPYVDLYNELLGFAALLIEAALGMPQIIKNFKNRSTKGLSYIMIATWAFGDTYKLIYYTISAQPLQFILCSAIQLFDDVVVLCQMWFFRPPRVKRQAGPGTVVAKWLARISAYLMTRRVSKFLIRYALKMLQVEVQLKPAGFMTKAKKSSQLEFTAAPENVF